MGVRAGLLTLLVSTVVVIVLMCLTPSHSDGAQPGQPTDWNRFYYYPYIYYPHNFQPSNQSYDHLYYRYPPHRRIPVYNNSWYNFYPTEKPYHWGHHFELDVF